MIGRCTDEEYARFVLLRPGANAKGKNDKETEDEVHGV
jgi:hypothetical protein